MLDSRVETGGTTIRLLWSALQSKVSEISEFLHGDYFMHFVPWRMDDGKRPSTVHLLRPNKKWHRFPGAIEGEKLCFYWQRVAGAVNAVRSG
jgi:hypothetical protein